MLSVVPGPRQVGGNVGHRFSGAAPRLGTPEGVPYVRRRGNVGHRFSGAARRALASLKGCPTRGVARGSGQLSGDFASCLMSAIMPAAAGVR